MTIDFESNFLFKYFRFDNTFICVTKFVSYKICNLFSRKKLCVRTFGKLTRSNILPILQTEYFYLTFCVSHLFTRTLSDIRKKPRHIKDEL